MDVGKAVENTERETQVLGEATVVTSRGEMGTFSEGCFLRSGTTAEKTREATSYKKGCPAIQGGRRMENVRPII